MAGGKNIAVLADDHAAALAVAHADVDRGRQDLFQCRLDLFLQELEVFDALRRGLFQCGKASLALAFDVSSANA